MAEEKQHRRKSYPFSDIDEEQISLYKEAFVIYENHKKGDFAVILNDRGYYINKFSINRLFSVDSMHETERQICEDQVVLYNEMFELFNSFAILMSITAFIQYITTEKGYYLNKIDKELYSRIKWNNLLVRRPKKPEQVKP